MMGRAAGIIHLEHRKRGNVMVCTGCTGVMKVCILAQQTHTYVYTHTRSS